MPHVSARQVPCSGTLLLTLSKMKFYVSEKLMGVKHKISLVNLLQQLSQAIFEE